MFDFWVRKIPGRRERLPTPVSWPGEFNGLYSPWGRKESDTTEQLSLSKTQMGGRWKVKSQVCYADSLPTRQPPHGL